MKMRVYVCARVHISIYEMYVYNDRRKTQRVVAMIVIHLGSNCRWFSRILKIARSNTYITNGFSLSASNFNLSSCPTYSRMIVPSVLRKTMRCVRVTHLSYFSRNNKMQWRSAIQQNNKIPIIWDNKILLFRHGQNKFCEEV